jgi:hypothetical protein
MQAFMGNCFFLASVLALTLRKDGAAHLTDHMEDGGEWIYGRLYDGADTARTMRAKKQYCNMTNPAGGQSIKIEANSKLWVSMLQVFASAFVLHNNNAGQVTYDKLNPSLTRLNSGYASSALKVLTGKKVGWQSTGDVAWQTVFKAKFPYPMVINSKKANALQAMFPAAGVGAALNHTTVHGIVGGHSYAVWNYQAKDFGHGPIDAVRIVNPWGYYRQTNYTTADNNTFSWNTDSAAGAGGDFWLPLALVPNFFEGFFWSEKSLGAAVA